ncbi:MAG: efflux RND transporter permease subunit [Verrucomicrobiales bacterium]
MIRWFANNGIAANLLMIGILLAGLHSAFFRVSLEVIPSDSGWEIIYMEIPYRGATAKDVEKGVLIPVEEALEGLTGIREVNSDGMRGLAKFYFKPEKGTDLRELREQIRGRVEGISTFPAETETPKIIIPDFSRHLPVLSVAVTGDLPESELREVTHRVYQDLLEIEGISRADIQGERSYEISVEAKMEKLRSYNLGFQELADAIRRSSIDLPAGSINSDSGTLVVRTRGQAYVKEEFERIPVRAANGAEVMLGEVATVRDGFEENKVITLFNGDPAMFVRILRSDTESAIDISNKVQGYVKSSATSFPEGIHLYTWNDTSLSMRGRLGTLSSSLLQGCVLVFLILGVFLRPKVAFWVVVGIPVSFAGGIMLMPEFGITANVMSLFGFIIVLGVVVDDAIVTGENVYSRLQQGMDPTEAAVLGTKEVAVPVTFGVLTTVVAFLPLLNFDGRWGDFAGQIPQVVAPVLLFSLVESKLILPSHLKHVRLRGEGLGLFGRFQKAMANSLVRFVTGIYQPSLEFAVRHRVAVLSVFIAMGLAMAGYVLGGRMGFSSFPSVENLKVTASLNLPNDLPIERTGEIIDRITAATGQLKKDFVDPGTGRSLIQNVAAVTGSSRLGGRYDHSRGHVIVEVLPPSLRSEPGPKNSRIAVRWKELVGEIEEADSFFIRAELTGKRNDEEDKQPEALELELRGKNSEKKNEIAQRIKELLGAYQGINGSWAQINRGQDELEFTLKSRAAELGLTQQSLARQVRQAFYGEEAQRIRRGTDEIRIMVRLPRKERRSLHTLDRMKIRTASGAEVPLSTVANVKPTKAPTFVERNDSAEVIRIGAAPQDEDVDIVGIAKELIPEIERLVSEGKGLSFQFKGYIAEHEESRKRTIIAFVALFFALFALLAIPFKSVTQPFYVLLALPFGIIGALLGHMIMGITPSYLSIFGMLALAGVVVNDSLVMVDYINRRCREGMTLREAALEAGGRRFRPILLTSLTTFAGLLPLLMDSSLQAQFLIPMAVSLGFGVLFATSITLYLIPCALLLGDDVARSFRRIFKAIYG